MNTALHWRKLGRAMYVLAGLIVVTLIVVLVTDRQAALDQFGLNDRRMVWTLVEVMSALVAMVLSGKWMRAMAVQLSEGKKWKACFWSAVSVCCIFPIGT